VIDGPALRALLRKVMRSSAETSSGVAVSLAASLPSAPLPQPTRVAQEMLNSVMAQTLRKLFILEGTTTSFGNSTYDVRTVLRVAGRMI
jgi:hypothetical protein